MPASRLIAASIVAASLLAAPALAGPGGGKISGQVLDVRPGGRVVVAEQGPWQGPGTGLITRTIEVTPRTAVRMVRPTGKWENAASPGYELHPVGLNDVKPGDFVTVVTESGSSRATALDVVRTDDVGGFALPGGGR
jgi:hypothetical protein